MSDDLPAQDAGSQMNPNVANIIVGGVQIVATALAAAVMDKAGRRLLLLLSSSIMVTSLLLLLHLGDITFVIIMIVPSLCPK